MVTEKFILTSHDYKTPLFGDFICPPGFKFPYGSPFTPLGVTGKSCVSQLVQNHLARSVYVKDRNRILLPESVNKQKGKGVMGVGGGDKG